MSRFICVLFLALMLSAAAFTAPVPKHKPFASGWEEPVDPDGDCKIQRDKGVLTIEMPSTLHEYDQLTYEQFNAPRLLRKIEGDFVMQVRLRFARRPAKESTGVEHPYVAAGFLVITPEMSSTKWCRMEYRVAGFGVRPNGYVSDDVRYNDHVKGNIVGDREWSFNGKPEHVYLRLERRGEEFRYSTSPDDKVWVKRGIGQVKGLPSTLKVGLAAYSTSAEPSKVLFDQLKFGRGKKKNK